jgi:hypothetical protein
MAECTQNTGCGGSMGTREIADLLEKIKAYCPHTSEWKIYDTYISYMEHGQEIVTMLEGVKPEKYLQEMLDRIAPSNSDMYKILSEPIPFSSDKDILRHRHEIRVNMLEKAYANNQILECEYTTLKERFS